MNKQNEILKYKFLKYLENAAGYAEASIKKYEQAINQYEICFRDEDFGNYNSDKAMEYKNFLIEKNYKDTSYRTILHHIKKFFKWLEKQPGYRRKILSDHIDFLNVSKEINRLACQKVIIPYPKHEEVLKIVHSLPNKTEVELRNQCLLALMYCTGLRDGAARTLPFSAVNIEKMFVEQNPRKDMSVKFSKIIYSKIFNLDNYLIEVIKNYYELLVSKGFKDFDPFFPQSKRAQQKDGLSFADSTEISRKRWESLESIRTIFKESCEIAGIQYYYPHQFRHAALRKLLNCAKNALEIKALYQSFGHKNFITILESYANLDPVDQLEVLSKMNLNPDKMKDANIMNQAIKLIEDVKKL